MRCHDLVVFFAMQVARSLRIRSRYLAMPAGKARRTQAQLHAATRGSVRFHSDTSLQPERRMYANPHSSDAQSPKQMTAVSTACRPHRQSPNAEERSTLLTTLLGMHTMARRHCEAAPRQQAGVTAGGPSSHARRGRKVWAKPHHTAMICASAQSPRAQGGARRGLHWRSSFRCRSLRCAATHSTVCKKCDECVIGFEPTSGVLKRNIYRLDQSIPDSNMRSSKVALNLCEVLIEAPVARVL